MTNLFSATIWGRAFTLPIVYDCYGNKAIEPEQLEAMKSFSLHLDWIEKAKAQVEAYCTDCVRQDDSNQKKDNIFSYVMPRSIFVIRDKKQPRVALMCRYKYDPEHDLAIVFSLDGHATVCSQDTVL